MLKIFLPSLQTRKNSIGISFRHPSLSLHLLYFLRENDRGGEKECGGGVGRR